MKLQDQVAIITGAASGMGKAIATLFAQEGAKVVVSDINQTGVDTTVSEIQSHGGKALGILTNVAKEEDVKKLIDQTVNEYGSLDILVNNAGIMDEFIPIAEVTDELWERVLAVNTTGPMRMIRQAIPHFLSKKSGVIVNIASVGGLFGSRAGVSYTASKHAVVGMTKNVGFQYAREGIRCNAIAPGGVETNINTTMSQPSEFGMKHAMSGADFNPRTGKPEEIAKIALFLASNDATFVNGTVITADAGWTAY